MNEGYTPGDGPTQALPDAGLGCLFMQYITKGSGSEINFFMLAPTGN